MLEMGRLDGSYAAGKKSPLGVLEKIQVDVEDWKHGYRYIEGH